MKTVSSASQLDRTADDHQQDDEEWDKVASTKTLTLNLEKLVVPNTPRKSERVVIGHQKKPSIMGASKSQASDDSFGEVIAADEASDQNSNYTNTSIKRFGDSSEDASS